MALNARERALALVSVLKPTDLVPCRVLAELLAEVGAAPFPVTVEDGASAPVVVVEALPPSIGGPPHPDGWTTTDLAEYYACGASTMRGRIEAGEFGVPESEGGPRKAGRRGWFVPHHQVIARDGRVQGKTQGVSVIPQAEHDGVVVEEDRVVVDGRAAGSAARRPSASIAPADFRRPAATFSLTDARRQRRAESAA